MTVLTQRPIWLDGQPFSVTEGSTLADLISALGHAPDAIGTAVNGFFVARNKRGSHVLREQDAVLVFQPIVGG